jgi:O-antigen/teichoic acid export membrane protein
LGEYAIAALLLSAIEGGLAGILGAVSLPALSEIIRTSPERLCDAYYKLRAPADLLLLFAGGVLFVAGGAAIETLYDPRYLPAGPILQVIAVSFVAARYNVSYQIYLALGKPEYLAFINFIRCIALFGIVPVAFVYGGAEAAIWAIALHGFAMIPFLLAVNYRFGVLDIRKELLVLVAWPVGLVAGQLLTMAL